MAPIEKTTQYDRLNTDDLDSGSDRDDPTPATRLSEELNEDARALLREEDEHEELLARKEPTLIQRLFRQRADAEGTLKLDRQERRRLAKEARQSQKNRRRGGQGDELMYEMEEGGPGSEFSTSRSSSESDLTKLPYAADKKTKRGSLIKRLTIFGLIAIFFLILLFLAYKATKRTKSRGPVATFSNGTAIFAPTTIIVSLDGFRADFLNRGLTPALNGFIKKGISPLYMTASFPSVTFPNHFTLVTGLYPESHGIVGNTFWDPNLKDDFYYTREGAMDPKWWNGEPIWVTAERQNVRTAIHMWPGSEAHIDGIDPTFVDKFNGSETLSAKVDRVLELLDLPGQEAPGSQQQRPQLIAAYVPVVDTAGHKYGPNSTEIRQTIRDVDNMLADLFAGLEARNLTDIVNLVVVSDHGMATTATERLIQLEDLVDISRIEHNDGWPLFGLRPKEGEDVEKLYNEIKSKAEKIPQIEVYLRDRDMPERYHYRNNDRIAPLWIVPEAGWAVVKKEEFNVAEGRKEGKVYHPRGLHGYDPEHPLMRAIFVAHGPAFPHNPDSRMDVFQNTEVYNILCESIGVVPSPNNGTLHLPLHPIGLHSDAGAPKLDTPEDLPPSEPKPQPDSKPESKPEAKPDPQPVPQASEAPSAIDVPAPPPSIPSTTVTPEAEEEAEGDRHEAAETVKGWISWITDKLQDFKEFVHGLVGGSS